MRIHSLNFQLQAMIITVTVGSLLVMASIFRITQELAQKTGELSKSGELNRLLKEWDSQLTFGWQSRRKFAVLRDNPSYMANFRGALQRINRVNGEIKDLRLDVGEAVSDSLASLWIMQLRYQEAGLGLDSLISRPEELEARAGMLDSMEASLKENLRATETLMNAVRRHMLDDMDATMSFSKKLTGILIILILLANIVIWIMLNRRVLLPLRSLAAGVRRIGDGELGLQIEINTRNELRQLVEVLNRMSSQLKDHQDTQSRLHKLEAIGQIAASVNHEINNPLMIISGNAEYLQRVLGAQDEKVARKLQTIIQEVRRIFEVTQKLKEIKNPVVERYASDDTTMIDLNRSI